MITEDHVSYEVARLLKEKGFDEPCECAYSAGGQYLLSCYKGIADRRIKNDEASDFSYSSTAPTHQMAMKWLREHKIYIMIDRSWSMEDSWQYCICVNNDFDHLIQQDSIPNRTYEEAVETALKYVLENLI